MTLTAGNNSPREGEQPQYYFLTLSNAGPGVATGVQVTDLLPAGLLFVSGHPAAGTSYEPLTGVWTVGTLAAGANVQLQIITRVIAMR